jgi:predicted amidophosphoribosyltransferase
MNGLNIDENNISYIEKYRPYRLKGNVKNPAFNLFSSKVLDIKENKGKAIGYFYNILKKHIPLDENTAIVVVPSHDPAAPKSGILNIGKKLSKTAIDATSCLVRTKKIPKLADGGTRNINVHLKSIKLCNEHMIQGRNVILLDDVTTTGNSLLACKMLLKKANPKNITMIAIGKTQS